MRSPSTTWQLERRIPIALLVGLMAHAGATVWFFGRLSQTVEQQSSGLRDMRDEVRVLAKTVEGSSIPAALTTARLTMLEQQLAEIRARVLDNERDISRKRP